MTIYDVPVDDTVFFPVSGDMMRQMKYEEAERLGKQNDTGDPAKNPSDAVNSNNLKGEQAMLHVSVSHDDLVVHPIWCDPEQCIAPDPLFPSEPRLHQKNIAHVEAPEGRGVDIILSQLGNDAPHVLVGDSELNAEALTELMVQLRQAWVDLLLAEGAHEARNQGV